MNTLKDNPMDNHCAVLRSDDNYQSDVKKSRFKSHVLHIFLSFFIIAISVIYSPVYAAINESGQNGSELEKQTPSKPDSFTEYAAQQVNALKDESVSISGITEEIFDPTERNAVEQAGRLQGDTALTGEYSESYYILDKLNAGLPPLSEPANLETPLAALEFFQSALMKQQYDLAAYALNMNLIDEKSQRSRALDLTKRLDFLLSEKELYVFDDMPDRPDGLIEPPLGNNSSVMGIARRSIQLGYVDYRERRVPIYLQRVRVGDQAPVWVYEKSCYLKLVLSQYMIMAVI